MNTNNKSLIMIPYANIDVMKGGVNIAQDGRFDIYMQNSCVALLSAKQHNPDSDVALVTNVDIPGDYKTVLDQNDILVIKAPFDSFRFPDDYQWGLAFYKLCALKFAVEKLDYTYFAYLDSDVYVQANFENIWRECDDNIMLYDINHGLQVRDYRNVLAELQKFMQTNQIITHYGGEFFAANRKNAEFFLSEANKVFQQMREENFYTAAGDEFILSVVSHNNKTLVRNAGAYIYRFWTGLFHLVSTCYQFNPIVVLHVPDEKKFGMIKLYRYYIKHSCFPPLPSVWRILNIDRQSHPQKTVILMKQAVKKILKR